MRALRAERNKYRLLKNEEAAGCGVAGFVFLKKSLGTSLQKITGGASSERSPKDI